MVCALIFLGVVYSFARFLPPLDYWTSDTPSPPSHGTESVLFIGSRWRRFIRLAYFVFGSEWLDLLFFCSSRNPSSSRCDSSPRFPPILPFCSATRVKRHGIFFGSRQRRATFLCYLISSSAQDPG